MAQNRWISGLAGLVVVLGSFWLIVWFLGAGASDALTKLNAAAKAPESASYLYAVVSLSALREVMVLKAAILAIALGCAVVGLAGLVLDSGTEASPRRGTSLLLLVGIGAGLLLLSAQVRPKLEPLPSGTDTPSAAAAAPGDAGTPAPQPRPDGGSPDAGTVADGGVPDRDAGTP